MATKKIKNKKKKQSNTAPQNVPKKNVAPSNELNTFDKMLIWMVERWKKFRLSTKLTIIVIILLIISFIFMLQSINTNSANINIYINAILNNQERDMSLIYDFVISVFLVIINAGMLIILMIYKTLASFVRLLKPEYSFMAQTFKEEKQVRLKL